MGHGQLNSIKSVQSLVEVITIVSFKDLIWKTESNRVAEMHLPSHLPVEKLLVSQTPELPARRASDIFAC